jgi:hypothetical protein
MFIPLPTLEHLLKRGPLIPRRGINYPQHLSAVDLLLHIVGTDSLEEDHCHRCVMGNQSPPYDLTWCRNFGKKTTNSFLFEVLDPFKFCGIITINSIQRSSIYVLSIAN